MSKVMFKRTLFETDVKKSFLNYEDNTANGYLLHLGLEPDSPTTKKTKVSSCACVRARRRDQRRRRMQQPTYFEEKNDQRILCCDRKETSVEYVNIGWDNNLPLQYYASKEP